MTGIPGYEAFTKIEPLNKGWSSDQKYYIETVDGRRLLLRVADIVEYDRKFAEFDMLKRVAELDIPVSRPIDFGVCDDGKSVCQLLTWIDGTDAQSVLPTLTETEQYALGWKAGETLRKMHSIPAPGDVEDWGVRFSRKVQARIEFYDSHPIRSENSDLVVRYLQDNQRLLYGRPQTFNHGDFNTTNLIVTPDGKIGVIDFNYYNSDHGDPWWEFDPASWGNEPNAYFVTGLFNGYFGGNPPSEFFTMQAYYSAYDALAALCDTSAGEQGEPEDGRRHMDNTLRWFDNMQNPVPTWYLKDFHVQYLDGIPCKLKEAFDFSFLNEYGKVFQIFDEQSSGCICFGVSNGKNKYFIKFAGVRTINNFDLPVSDAIARLKAAVPKYMDLAHPLLIHFIESKRAGNGYMLVFDWEDGESCFGDKNPSLHEKFHALPAHKKVEVYEEVLRFHEHAAKCGYVAIDFNDYSILYDFDNGKTTICDIDFYARQSYINGMGRALGDPAVMSPEEYRIGGLLDEVTNVYTMGATAFVLFSNNDRSPEAWPLSPELYAVIQRATSDDRNERQQTIAQLIGEWRAAQ